MAIDSLNSLDRNNKKPRSRVLKLLFSASTLVACDQPNTDSLSSDKTNKNSYSAEVLPVMTNGVEEAKVKQAPCDRPEGYWVPTDEYSDVKIKRRESEVECVVRHFRPKIGTFINIELNNVSIERFLDENLAVGLREKLIKFAEHSGEYYSARFHAFFDPKTQGKRDYMMLPIFGSCRHINEDFVPEIEKELESIFKRELLRRFDFNGDGLIDRQDGVIKTERCITNELTREDLAPPTSLVSYINMDPENAGQFHLAITDLNGAAGEAGYSITEGFLNALGTEKSIDPTFAAHLGLAQLDVNTDLKISEADDINHDGEINPLDFETIRALQAAMKLKYGESFDSAKISAMDMIVFLNDHYLLFSEQISSGKPKDSNFEPHIDKQPLKVEQNETKKEYELPVGQRIIEEPAGKRRLLGATAGALVGRALKLPFLPSVVAGAVLAPRRHIGRYRLEQISERHIEEEKITMEYFKIENEINEIVTTAVFTTPQGYKVFYFDSSRTLTETFMHQTAVHYLDGKLTSSTHVESKINSTIQKTHNTSGRILVLDPRRNMKAIVVENDFNALSYLSSALSGNKPNDFVGLYYGSDSGGQMATDGMEELLKSFQEARRLVRTELRQIYAIANGLKHFNPKLSLKRQSVYLQLKEVDKKD